MLYWQICRRAWLCTEMARRPELDGGAEQGRVLRACDVERERSEEVQCLTARARRGNGEVGLVFYGICPLRRTPRMDMRVCLSFLTFRAAGSSQSGHANQGWRRAGCESRLQMAWHFALAEQFHPQSPTSQSPHIPPIPARSGLLPDARCHACLQLCLLEASSTLGEISWPSQVWLRVETSCGRAWC